LNLGSVIKFAEAFNGKYSVSQKPLGFTFSKSQSWRIAFQKNSTTPNPFSIIHQTTTPSNAKALFLRKNEKNKQIEKKVSNFKKYIPIYSIPFTKEFSFEKTNCPNTKMIRKTKTDENIRSEEHTSELQSREKLVCRLLLEKKKNTMPNMAAKRLIAVADVAQGASTCRRSATTAPGPSGLTYCAPMGGWSSADPIQATRQNE